MPRKRRQGEVVCRCGAYRFPHRQLGGACDGGAFVERYFEDNQYSACRGCHFHEPFEEGTSEARCQVLDGREKPVSCPALEEYIDYHEIRLYGVNGPT